MPASFPSYTCSTLYVNPAPRISIAGSTESHNVAADYLRAYGKSAPRMKGLRIQINSQHTGTVAESYFGDVTFRSALQ